ncbi:hypothetical protein M0R72_17865 [Candidatus Pacearchaeota archaeon]|jgi:hypothetical protein|nr:hypothetical protein [Candidatus Pacearchaeota archaeon]
MATSNEFMLSLQQRFSSNLAFRHSADDLFEYINSLSAPKIMIDFSGITSITRSFAHQYTVNKIKSDKQIIECEIPLNIKPMFELVERQRMGLQKGN